MGKSKQKDRAYITMKEWTTEWGGKEEKNETKTFSKLPFYCCAISFQPFSTPVCTPDGYVFDLLNIVPYIKKNNTHPVTGAALALKDIIRLNFHKNSQGEFHCPITFKVFTETTHIVAIKTSGNVFSYETVELFNIKQKNWTDLISGEHFTRADIITLQDPKSADSRDASRFYHVKHDLAKSEESNEPKSTIVSNPAMNRILAKVKPQLEAMQIEQKNSAKRALEEFEEANKKAKTDDPNMIMTTQSYSRGKMSSSFTSSAVDVTTRNEAFTENIRRQLKPKKKGYVRLKTNFGDLNLELHCDKTPKTCENFIRLCQKGYYDGIAFHRNVMRFMIQGGDPTGTGKGGESIFGSAFEDEIRETLKHSEKGVLSMANSGPNTNNSQFFICYRAAPHLDGKHTVFGRVVGGLDTLDRMEEIPSDSNEKPTEKIYIMSAVVFVDPYTDMLEAEKAEKEKKQTEEAKALKPEDDVQWYSNPKPTIAPKRNSIIGKYISPQVQTENPAEAEAGIDLATSSESNYSVSDLLSKKKKQPRATNNLGDFSGW
eukprot:c19782_g1_i1.p1 GENE.c19782_g1_i1~~c19782_g1_i1.p1  ORF type:complete len:543 (+),score=231.54 c19782_g1_i1:103-1731(+)